MKRSSKLGVRFRGCRTVQVLLLVLFGLVPLVPMPVVECPCDHAKAGSMQSRVCSLCGTAERATEEVYFLKDINPHKPNRYLALPKAHAAGYQSTADLSPRLRTELWRKAAARGEELFPGRWGVAQNSHFFRTQCHAHLHIGPLSPEVQDTDGTLYGRVEEIPDIGPEQGIWLHPKQDGFCVHLDRDLAEIVLIR